MYTCTQYCLLYHTHAQIWIAERCVTRSTWSYFPAQFIYWLRLRCDFGMLFSAILRYACASLSYFLTFVDSSVAFLSFAFVKQNKHKNEMKAENIEVFATGLFALLALTLARSQFKVIGFLCGSCCFIYILFPFCSFITLFVIIIIIIFW